MSLFRSTFYDFTGFRGLFDQKIHKTGIPKRLYPKIFLFSLSIDNTLAIHNSELLSLYTKFDERVAPLGFAIKCWAKLYGINDASLGSISSYAYIVMLIYYLQRCSPPVLPFLQEV